jgi:DNA repair protein RadD
MLRPYQQRAIDQLYDWMRNNEGNPCAVLPTGAGKSHIVAALCKNALQEWPETRILMLTHVKELIEQNAEKLRQHWLGAPLGIYSASIGKRQLGEPITFAGIQSIAKKSDLIGFVDLIIIDECHLVSHKAEGGYRTLISELLAINPALRVIGLTATPYRLGHGYITDKPAIFDGMVEPVSIEELIALGYLSTLRSKHTVSQLDTSNVHKRGGEFIESELQAAVDNDDDNAKIVAEVISLAGDRKAWLFFCAGVAHAEHIADELVAQGITAACITGSTPKTERAQLLADFKSGKIKALTNANVLTTGFDYPDIDLIAMLRPTMSPSLYVQMAGRGLRPKSHTDHCLVLDFAGVVATHGPITAVCAPQRGKTGDEKSEAPTKDCENCGEICAISVSVCPACLNPFPVREKPPMVLRDDDIMGKAGRKMAVTGWSWSKHVSAASGNEMLKCKIYGGLADKTVTTYHAIHNAGYGGDKAMREFAEIAHNAGVSIVADMYNLLALVDRMNSGRAPDEIEYIPDGKFFRVIARSWNHAETP